VLWVWLADVVLALHFAYVAFIPLGGALAWRWPRLVWAHLTAVGIGLVSITVGFDCPLTTWEQSLRRRGGQRPYTDGFVDHYLTGHVYPHGYDWAVQVIFGVCIVASYARVAARAGHGFGWSGRSPDGGSLSSRNRAS
jgi:Protein of Unknown function (DUF2784)